MDSISAVSQFKSQEAMGQVQVAVARKALDVQEEQGKALVCMIQDAKSTADQAAGSPRAGGVDTYA